MLVLLVHFRRTHGELVGLIDPSEIAQPRGVLPQPHHLDAGTARVERGRAVLPREVLVSLLVTDAHPASRTQSGLLNQPGVLGLVALNEIFELVFVLHDTRQKQLGAATRESV